MVLQRGANTSIWGTSPITDDTIYISINGSEVGNALVDANHVWQAVFSPPDGYGPFTINATSSLGAVTLDDVWFGDVWICSGQSNMGFNVNRLLNKTDEYKDAVNYPHVRLFNMHHTIANTTLTEISRISQSWALPSEKSLHAFSALCWLYGKQLSEHLQIPIGLVETAYGGTVIEAWSSPDALSQCPASSKKRFVKQQNKASVLHNAMINPLLRNTIKGVIWYQGESNSGNTKLYSCRFPAMIKDWRQKFSTASRYTTSSNFPFGFVQVYVVNIHYTGSDRNMLETYVILAPTERATQFGFSKYYQNHMVLQKGKHTVIWGTSSKVGDKVHISINGSDVGNATVDSSSVWQVVFTPPHGIGPYTIQATSSLGAVTLDDVLFGDVWICSGQSNMEFYTQKLMNSTEEYNDAANYPHIRLIKNHHTATNTTKNDISVIDIPWSLPSAKSLKLFSALCWLYGKQLSQHLQYPIGLVESNWGGTVIEAWSSSDALARCPVKTGKRDLDKNSHSVLYDGMIYPLLRNTIKGVIWYQGESDAAGHDSPLIYSCQFPTMIMDWRKKFNQASKHTTSAGFPFGFVQIAPSKQGDRYSRGWTDLRWSQTASIGYVPNPKMPHTFMAVAMDLPDFQSPYGSGHPRYKHDIARRLVLSALAVAYHEKGFDFQGPFPSSYTLNSAKTQLSIEYDHGKTPIEIRSNHGFDIHCPTVSPTGWRNATMVSHTDSTVVLDVSNCDIDYVRYAWRNSPCELRKCAVYSRDSDLPAPPLLHHMI
ncbi:hypothetical protein FSP39_024667 [Pinctada imbricata]|uniref:Sialate O-acetylesterase domain-containing protein n=1 Tax=Pinctada imbricata TaxID=66713 RepID=A0AA88Y1K9_PINIB|nr:hypothetical protein FSP39_024667 [Pinctada imbricata]